MIDGFTLLRPQALWLLLLIVPTLWLLIRANRATGSWQKAIDPDLLPHILVNDSGVRQRRSHWLLIIALMLAVVAIAGPSIQKIDVPVFQRADAMVIVLDLSASMTVADIQPSRIDRSRQKILDLLAERQEGVTGLVVFAGDAHVVAPLTDDRRTIKNLLPALHPSIMPIPGSDATAALRIASELLGAAGVANGNILLITDGMPGFDPEDVRSALTKANAQLGILGMGTEGGAPIPRADGGFVRNQSGEIVVPMLDSERLEEIAAALGGRFARVTVDNKDLDELKDRLMLGEQSDIQLDRKTDTWLDQGNWLALLLALSSLPLFRRGTLVLPFSGVLVLSALLHSAPGQAGVLNELFQNSDQRGQAALETGNPGRAAQLFESPDWQGTAEYEAGNWEKAAQRFGRNESADGFYNKGNALALAGKLEAALAAYERSLEIAPDQADAIQNRDLIRQLLEQQQSEQRNNDQSEQDDGDQSEDQSEPGQTSKADSENQESSEQNRDSDDSQEDSPDTQDSEGQEGDGENRQQDSSQATPGDSDDAMNDALDAALEEQTDAQMAKFDEALEKQQALEQWLRRVPDDPGGLLKRKFRYESIQRLRNGEEPDDDIRW